MDWYVEVLKKYAVFSGRARRKEYWYFALINLVITFAIAFADSILGTYNPTAGVGLLGTIYGLAVFLPSLAVSIRRLHDTDRSGWWLLIAFVPLVGALVLLVFMFLDSNSESNRFGENPKADEVY